MSRPSRTSSRWRGLECVVYSDPWAAVLLLITQPPTPTDLAIHQQTLTISMCLKKTIRRYGLPGTTNTMIALYFRTESHLWCPHPCPRPPCLRWPRCRRPTPACHSLHGQVPQRPAVAPSSLVPHVPTAQCCSRRTQWDFLASGDWNADPVPPALG